MKAKVYIAPEITITKIAGRHKICVGSNEYSGSNSVLNPGTMDYGDGSDAASRGYNIWDE